MRRVSRVALGLGIVALAYGSCFLLEARPSRHTSWPQYLALALAAGVVLLCAEAGTELVMKRDRRGDVAARRFLHLAALLAVGVIAAGALWLLARRM